MEAARISEAGRTEGGLILVTHPLVSQIQNALMKEANLVQGDVPVDIIYTEDVPVDADNVAEVRKSLQSERSVRTTLTGQLSPVILADVVDVDIDQFLIVDGFHRTTIAKEDGSEFIDGRVRLESTMEQVIDLRIQTAATHKSLRFARVNEWMDDAWGLTEWKDRLTPLEAFSFVNRDGGKLAAKNLGLSPAEAKELREWVLAKCARWDLSTSSVYQSLLIASVSDPELVKTVRERNGRHKTLDALTSQHMKRIGLTFPGNYEMQQLVAGLVLENNLSVPYTNGLLEILRIGETPDEVEELLADPKLIASIEPIQTTELAATREADARPAETYVPSIPEEPAVPPTNDRSKAEGNSAGKTGPTTPHSNNGGGVDSKKLSKTYRELAELFVEDEVGIAIMSLENLILRGRYSPDIEAVPLVNHRLLLEDYNPELPAKWTVERIKAATQRMEATKEQYIERVAQRPGVGGKDVATELVDRAGRRVLKDTRTGALRYLDLDGEKVIDLVMQSTILDEVRQLANAARRASHKPAVQEVPKSFTRDIKILQFLPDVKDARDRRIVVMNSIFHFTPHIIAQVAGTRLTAENVTSILAGMTDPDLAG